jgi:hypothetical protein
MGDGITRRQRYVPRFHPKHFADRDCRLRTYGRDTGIQGTLISFPKCHSRFRA